MMNRKMLIAAGLLAATANAVVLKDEKVQLRGGHVSPLREMDPTPENWPEDGPWIVKVDAGQDKRVAEDAGRKAGDRAARGKKPYRLMFDFERDSTIVVEGVSKADLEAIAGVQDVQADIIRYATVASWGIDRIDQAILPLSDSYAHTIDGCGVDVYVLDTGVDTTHVEFQGGSRTVENIWNEYGSVTTNTDGHGHGTHCAGTIGGVNVGVSPCANIYGMKILSDTGSGATSGIIAALDEVQTRHEAKGAGTKSVVSMSLGGTCQGRCTKDSLVLKVNSLAAAGIVSSVAAGNSDDNARLYSPAAAVDAITVGASDSDDSKAYYSNYGNRIDIFAPGSDIVSACSSLTSGCSSGDMYVTMSGTSMAAPHVAGVLAQEHNAVNPTNVAEITAALLGDAATNTVTGTDSQTTASLLQVPTSSGPVPSQAPVFSPTAAPVVTNSPVVASTGSPVAGSTFRPTRRKRKPRPSAEEEKKK